jgi:mannose-6-phosphate isomerase-like protein (cupin superfamily)
MGMELDVTQPLLLRAGGGEIIGDSEDRRVEILSDHDALNATWSRFAAGREGADLHIHYRHNDLFYVLEGELTVAVGADGGETAVPAGTLVLVPPLVVHGFRNASSEEVRYLNFHAPGEGFADYLRGRRDGTNASFDSDDPPGDGGRPADAASIGAGELIADRNGLRVTLLADIDEIGIVEVWSEPGGPLPPADPNRRHTESLYILEGELEFSFGRAEPGAWVQLPAGAPFTCTVSGEGVHFLEIHTPPGRGFGDALRARLDQEPA